MGNTLFYIRIIKKQLDKLVDIFDFKVYVANEKEADMIAEDIALGRGDGWQVAYVKRG